jgi:hypothetical protein
LAHLVTLPEAFSMERLFPRYVTESSSFLAHLASGRAARYSIFLTPETALALSLTKRVRKLLLSLPRLLFFQIWNGIDLLQCLRREATPATVSVEGT